MYEERQRPRHAEERASDGRRCDDHRSLPAGDHRDRRGKLLLRDDRAECAGLSGTVERASHSLDERDDRDHPEDDLVSHDQGPVFRPRPLE